MDEVPYLAGGAAVSDSSSYSPPLIGNLDLSVADRIVVRVAGSTTVGG